MAFMKIFPKNSTVIMNDFWPFEPCVRRQTKLVLMQNAFDDMTESCVTRKNEEDIIELWDLFHKNNFDSFNYKDFLNSRKNMYVLNFMAVQIFFTWNRFWHSGNLKKVSSEELFLIGAQNFSEIILF